MQFTVILSFYADRYMYNNYIKHICDYNHPHRFPVVISPLVSKRAAMYIIGHFTIMSDSEYYLVIRMHRQSNPVLIVWSNWKFK